MTASDLPFINSAASWEIAPLEAVQLSLEQVDQALDRAKAMTANEPSRLWQRYLNELAQNGFEQWLGERDPELSIEAASIRPLVQPGIQPGETEINLVKVSGFSICLLAQGHQPEEFIEMPSVLVDETIPKAHFYVVAAIAEEQGTVEIFAVLRQDQLIQKRSLLPLNSNNHYSVPLNWFEGEADALLLYLRCSEPAAFAQSSQPGILAPASAPPSEPLDAAPRPPANSKQLAQAAVNAALWSEGVLDEMSQQLSWVLMPRPAFADAGQAMRGSRVDGAQAEDRAATDEAYPLIQTLRSQGVAIPEWLRPATKTFDIGGESVRLYALAWSTGDREWELVLILGPAPNRLFPGDVRLVVEDQTQELVEEQLCPGGPDDCIFVNLSADVNEIFLAKIKLGNQVVEVLPTFSFQPRQV